MIWKFPSPSFPILYKTFFVSLCKFYVNVYFCTYSPCLYEHSRKPYLFCKTRWRYLYTSTCMDIILSWKWQSATVCNHDKSVLTFKFGTPSFHNLFVMCVSLICLQRNNKNKLLSPAYIDFSRSRDCIMTNHIDRLHRSKGKEIVSSLPNKEKKEVSDGMKSDSIRGPSYFRLSMTVRVYLKSMHRFH